MAFVSPWCELLGREVQALMKGQLETDVMPTQVQEDSQLLLHAHKLHQRGLGPCAVLELQFQTHPEPLGCVTHLFWEGQEAF